MYFTAHPCEGWGHLGEEVRALWCGREYTSMGSGVARLQGQDLVDVVLQILWER